MNRNQRVSTRILNLLINMKNKGYADASIKTADCLLKITSRTTNLDEPENVNKTIATKQGTGTYKRNLVKTYALYAKYYKLDWNRPNYIRDTKAIRVPLKEGLLMLVAHAGKSLGTKLEISYKTGMCPIEICELKVNDIDLEKN